MRLLSIADETNSPPASLPDDPAQGSPGMAGVLGGTEIAIAYKIGYVLNFYREPSFRRIETEFGITRPEIVTLIVLNYREGVTASDICEFSGHLKANISRCIPMLREREKAMLACLTAAERRSFERILDKLAAHVPDWAAAGEL